MLIAGVCVMAIAAGAHAQASEAALSTINSSSVVLTSKTDGAPAAPRHLSATAAFATEVYLSWVNIATDATRITVERATGSDSFVVIATLDGVATAYTDRSISPTTRYSYVVYASNSSGSSIDSNVARARTTIALITNPNTVFDEPSIVQPAYGGSYIDPVFRTKITRIGGEPGAAFTTANDGPGLWSYDARHMYSLFQPWNITNTLYAIQNRVDAGGQNGGIGGSWLHLEGSGYLPALGPPSRYPDAGADERWNPNRRYATQVVVAGNIRPTLWWFDIANNVITRSWQLPFVPQYFGGGKGQITRDGRFVVMVDISQTKMAVVDMDPQPPYPAYPSKRIGPVYNIESMIGGATYARATASFDPSGKYVLLRYATKNGASGQYQRVYDVDPATLALKLHLMPAETVQCTGSGSDNWIYGLGHSDLTLNPFDNNEPVVIGQEGCGFVRQRVAGVKTVNSNGIGHVVMVRLRDGSVTSLTDPGNYTGTALEAYAHHISAQNSHLQGWVFVTYGASPSQEHNRFYDEVIALSLDGLQRVQRLAHLHSDFTGYTAAGAACEKVDDNFNYRSESHGVPSPGGKKLAFASNWLIRGTKASAQCSIQDYIINAR
jgi:hypothetical protein